MIGHRLMPIRHNVWRWEIYSRKDNRILEAGQIFGSKVKANTVAATAARAWTRKTKS